MLICIICVLGEKMMYSLLASANSKSLLPNIVLTPSDLRSLLGVHFTGTSSAGHFDTAKCRPGLRGGFAVIIIWHFGRSVPCDGYACSIPHGCFSAGNMQQTCCAERVPVPKVAQTNHDATIGPSWCSYNIL